MTWGWVKPKVYSVFTPIWGYAYSLQMLFCFNSNLCKMKKIEASVWSILYLIYCGLKQTFHHQNSTGTCVLYSWSTPLRLNFHHHKGSQVPNILFVLPNPNGSTILVFRRVLASALLCSQTVVQYAETEVKCTLSRFLPNNQNQITS